MSGARLWRRLVAARRPHQRALTGGPAAIHSGLPDVSVPDTVFHEQCWAGEKQFGSRLALLDGVRGEGFTLSEARGLAGSLAGGLAGLADAQPGQVLALLLPNCPEYAVLFLGGSEAGLVLTTLNPTYTAHEIRLQVENSGAGLLATTPALLDKAREAVAGLGVRLVLVGGEDPTCLSYSDLVRYTNSSPQARRPTTDNVAVLPYSSGTTGVPKGVKLTHRNLVAQMVQMAAPQVEVVGRDEITICVLPMYHIFAMNVTMSNMLWHGGTTVTVPSFDPAVFLWLLLSHRPTTLHLAPPLVSFLASHPMATPEHLASVKTVVVGAAPAGPALIALFLKKAPHVRFREGYGMTEMSPAVTFTRTDGETSGSCGQLLPNTEMKVLDLATGNLLGPGHTGELCFRGPQVMPGYLNNPSATAETLVDGWIHSGDIGYYDKDGFVFIVDRKKELIKVKGLQVAPAELENLLRGLVGVRDVAVIGVPDQRAGEVPRAYVVRETEALTEQEVAEHVERSLSRHKHLAGGVEFVKEIPKSAAGKILRKDLRYSYNKRTIELEQA